MALGIIYTGEPEAAIKEFVKLLMGHKDIQGAVVPVKMERGSSYAFVFTKSPEVVDKSSPIAPVMTVQGARVLSKLTKKKPLTKPAVAVLKPCEVRAARELSKINQVCMGSFITVSFDCPGVYPTKSFLKNEDALEEEFKKGLRELSVSNVRPLCESCIYFTGEFADFEVQFAGINEVRVIARSQRAEVILKDLGKAEEVEERDEKAIEAVAEARKKAKEALKTEFAEKVSSPEKLLSVLSNCMNCHNCRSVCPICFCRECFFDSDALKTPPHLYLERASRKGGLRFMPDTLLFHLGRMNHMSLSCVSCGTCEDACPNMVPVSRLFALASERTRAIFDYVPGVDDRPSPFLEYREEELEEYEVPYYEART